MARKRKKDAAEEAVQETQESPALDPGEIRFSVEDAESVGDPAAASTDVQPDQEPTPDPEPVPLPPQPEQTWDRPPEGESPADADRRAAEQAPGVGAALGPIAGAFVGSFVLAKIIGRFGGEDD
jgi:hypothetical protein